MASRDLRIKVTHDYGYLAPWRAGGWVRGRRYSGIGCGLNRVRRRWVRYLIIQVTEVEFPGSGVAPRTRFVAVGWTWTRRGADRVVESLRRSA